MVTAIFSNFKNKIQKLKRLATLLLMYCIYQHLHAQCFSGLEDTTCNNLEPWILTPADTGGYFGGEGVGFDGTFNPALLAPGIHYVSYNNTNFYVVDTTGIFDPAEGSGTFLSLIDDGFCDGLPLGFSFEFFGSVKNYVRVHSNGFISFDFMPAIFPPYANDIPTPGMPTDFIAASWGDYDPTSGGTIDYFTTGTIPFRKMVINYTDLPPYGGAPGNLTAQIILYETTNIIEIHTTASPDYGYTKSQGIENVDGTVGFVRPGRNNMHWEAYNDYVAFIPQYCIDSTLIIAAPDVNIIEDFVVYAADCPGYYVHVTGASAYTVQPPFDTYLLPTGTEGEFEFTGYPPFAGDSLYVPISGSDTGGCPDTDSVLVYFTGCEPVNDIADPLSLLISPNPAQDAIHISTSAACNNAAIEIYTLQGRKLFTGEISAGQMSISTAGFPDGIYLVQLHTNDTSVSSTVVIIR